MVTKSLAIFSGSALPCKRHQTPHGDTGPDKSPGHRDDVAQGVRDTNSATHLLSRSMVGNARCLYESLSQRLDSLQAEVRQCGNLDTAAFFARFILNSRVVDLLSELEPQGAVLRMDCALVRWKAEELLRSVQDVWRSGKATPAADVATLTSITRKLDLLAGAVSNLIDSTSVQRARGGVTPERREASPGERLTLLYIE